MDKDGHPDVIALRLPSSEIPGQADMFSLQSDGEVVTKTARLSKGLKSITHMLSGSLSDMSPAIYIEGDYSDSSVITDILTWRYGNLYNISANTSSGVSQDTLRSDPVYSTDINSDGVVDVPFPRLLTSLSDTKYYAIDWYTYNKYGDKTKVFATYHNFSDRWYLILPDDWKNNFTVRREDTVSGERTLIFSYSVGNEKTPVDFLKIYTLSGDNKNDRAKLPGRFTLIEHGDIIYAAEILTSMTGITVNKTQITNGFKLLYSDWATGVIS